MPGNFELAANIVWSKAETAAFFDWFDERVRRTAALATGGTGGFPKSTVSDHQITTANKDANKALKDERETLLKQYILALRKNVDNEANNYQRSLEANIAYEQRVGALKQSAFNMAAVAANEGALAKLTAENTLLAEQQNIVNKEALFAARLKAESSALAINVASREQILVPGAGPFAAPPNPSGKFLTAEVYAANRAAQVDLSKIAAPYSDINAINANLAQRATAAEVAREAQRAELSAIVNSEYRRVTALQAQEIEAETVRRAAQDAERAAEYEYVKQRYLQASAQVNAEIEAEAVRRATATFSSVATRQVSTAGAFGTQGAEAIQYQAINANLATIRAKATEEVSFYQRLRGSIKGVDPSTQPTLQSQLGGQFLHTAGFLVAGAALFGVVRQLHEAFDEATKLTKEFGIIQSILANVGESNAFEGIKKQVFELSTSTAVAADKVATAERILAGVFANDQGVPDFTRAAKEAETVLKTSQVTGEAVNKLENQLTAISLSFADKAGVAPAFKDIVDYSLALEQSLGTGSAEILQFTASVAPLASELGFTIKQLEGLGAVMAQVSGQSASTLSEQLSRILAGLGEKLPKLTELLGSDPKTADLLGPIGEAFGQGKIPDVLRILVENFNKLNQVQIDNLALLVGGRREAGTFFSLLAKAPETLKALDEGFKTTGNELGTRFTAVTKTLGFAFEKAQIEFQKFALALLDSGLADGILLLAHGFEGLFSVLNVAVDAFHSFNEVTSGVPGNIIGITVAVLALAKALTIVRATAEALAGLQLGKALLGARATAALTAGTGGVSGGALAGATGGGLLAAGANALYTGLLGVGIKAGVTSSYGAATAAGAGIIALPAALAGEAVHEFFARRQDLGKQGDANQALYLKALQEGKTYDQLRLKGDQGIAFGVSERLGLHGDINEPLDRALKQFQQPRKTAELDVLAGLEADEETKKKFTQLSQALAKDPTNAANNKLADFILKSARARNDPAIEAGFKSINAIQDLDAKAQHAIAAVNDPKTVKTIAELQKAVDRGDSGATEVDALIKAQITHYQTVIDGLKKGGAEVNDPNLVALEQEQDKLQVQMDTNIKDGILKPLEFAQKLRKALHPDETLSDVQQTIDEVIAAAQALDATGNLDATTEQDLLFRAIDAISRRRKVRADAANSPAAKAATLATPEPLPPEVIRLEADIQLRQGPGADLVKDFANKTGQKGDEARKHIVDEFVRFNGDITQVEAVLRQEEAEYAKTAIDAANQLKGGIGLGVQGTQLYNTLVTLTGLPRQDFDTFSDIMKLNREQAGKLIEKLFSEAGGDVKKVVHEMHQLELAVAFKALQSAVALYNLFHGLFGIGTVDAVKKAFAAINKIKADIANEKGGFSIGEALGAGPKLDTTLGPDDGGGSGNGSTDTPQSIANAQLDIQAAQAKGDAVKLALIARERAAIAAKFAVTTTEKLQAQAAMITADQQLVAAQLAYNDSLRKVENARAGQDAVTVTKNALESAAAALADAVPGTEAYNNALAGYIDAQHAFAKATQDSKDAQTNYDIAVLNAAGDPVGAAKKKLQELLDRKADAGAEGITGDALINLNAQIVDATAALAQTQISQGEKQIQTALSLGRINKGQAIAQLQALKVFAINQEEIDQIDLQIKQLQGQLGQDFKFNLPSVLGLPTLYEARRVGQQLGGGGSGPGYNDNRIISVTVNATTNADPHQIATTVAEVIGPPRNYGTGGGRY